MTMDTPAGALVDSITKFKKSSNYLEQQDVTINTWFVCFGSNLPETLFSVHIHASAFIIIYFRCLVVLHFVYFESFQQHYVFIYQNLQKLMPPKINEFGDPVKQGV